MTLTEFLLARIAEDEAAARTEINRFTTDYGVAALVDASWAHDYMDPRRVLAECEAKRRIVEDATNQHTSGPELDWVVSVLALPYADHPDYREEWKP